MKSCIRTMGLPGGLALMALAIAIALPEAASAQSTAAPPAPADPAVTQPAPSETAPEPKRIVVTGKRVCKSSVPTGSIIPKRVCKSKAEWEAIRARSVAALEAMRKDQETARNVREALENR